MIKFLLFKIRHFHGHVVIGHGGYIICSKCKTQYKH